MNISPSNSMIPPTIPFHVAKAYGVPGSAQVSRGGGVTSGAASQAAQKTPAVSSELSAAGKRLVAGVVPGRVDFSGDQPTQSQAPLAMYRHPADKNAAATAVNVGRALDVAG